MRTTERLTLTGEMLQMLDEEGLNPLIAAWPELTPEMQRLEELKDLMEEVNALERLQRKTDGQVDGVIRAIEAALNA